MNHKALKISSLVLAVATAGFSSQTFSSGFALIEQSASGQGVAYAGAAAVGEDASTIFFNPAAMTRLSGQQIVFAAHVVSGKADYIDSGQSALGFDPTTGLPGTAGSLTGSNSEAFDIGVIPNFYWAAALDNGLHVGVGINVPFGLATDYDDGWVGRYHALNSEITAININPSMAWQASKTLSVGFGLSYQYVEVELTNNIHSPAVCFGLTGANTCPTAGDSALKLEGDDSSIGWNAGILWDITDKDRLGVAYRSAIKHDLSGDATYNMDSDPALQATLAAVNATIDPFTVFTSTTLTAAADLPETFSVSYVREVNTQWTFLADWTWTGWSSLDVININLAGGAPGQDPFLELEFANSNRYSVGAHYKPGNNWTFRGGLAYDETPIRSAEQRSPRIPGNDRTWLSLGFGYAPASSWSFDVAYTHIFVDDTPINNASRSSSFATLVGEYDASVDILSAGVTMNF